MIRFGRHAWRTVLAMSTQRPRWVASGALGLTLGFSTLAVATCRSEKGKENPEFEAALREIVSTTVHLTKEGGDKLFSALEHAAKEKEKLDDDDRRQLTRKEVRQVLFALDPDYARLAEMFISALDSNNDAKVDFWELIGALTMMSGMPARDKMEFLFRICDFDGNGRVSKNEMREMLTYLFSVKYHLTGCYGETANPSEDEVYDSVPVFWVSRIKANNIVKDIFEFADKDRDGFLTQREFVFWLRRHSNEAAQMGFLVEGIRAGGSTHTPKPTPFVMAPRDRLRS